MLADKETEDIDKVGVESDIIERKVINYSSLVEQIFNNVINMKTYG